MPWRRRTDDTDLRAKRALSLNDEVVQQLVTAKLALELGRPDDALAAVTTGLARAQAISSELLPDGTPQPGDLRPS